MKKEGFVIKKIQPVSWIASVWPDEQIILVIIDEIDPAQITFTQGVDSLLTFQINLRTCLVYCIKTKMTLFSLARMT